jgi:hypothetical protein
VPPCLPVHVACTEGLCYVLRVAVQQVSLLQLPADFTKGAGDSSAPTPPIHKHEGVFICMKLGRKGCTQLNFRECKLRAHNSEEAAVYPHKLGS